MPNGVSAPGNVSPLFCEPIRVLTVAAGSGTAAAAGVGAEVTAVPTVSASSRPRAPGSHRCLSRYVGILPTSEGSAAGPAQWLRSVPAGDGDHYPADASNVIQLC